MNTLERVQIGAKWGYQNQSGQVVIPAQFNWAYSFSEGLAVVKIGSKYGYIDCSGQMVVQPQFNDAKGCYGGLARIKIGNKWGYIDSSGQMVVQPQFDEAEDFVFSHGLAQVKIGNKYGYIDQKGQMIVRPKAKALALKELQRLNDTHSPILRSKIETSYGVVDTKLIAANNRFGFKLFEEIFKQQAEQNIFISPASIAMTLTMTYNGAKGDTQQAMAKTLELQGMSLEVINQANAVLKAMLANPDSKVQLSIANSLWSRQGFLFHPEFVQKSQEFYQAQVTALDFNNPDAPSIINAWVKQSTNGKIDKIVEQISSAILILIDVIYFKSKWAEPFRESATEMRPFTLLDGTSKQHPLMSQSGQYQYLHNDLFQAVSLPYGAGRLSLYIFLPHKEAHLQKQGSWVNKLLSLGVLFEPSQSETNTEPEFQKNTNRQSFQAFYDSLHVKNWEQWMSQFSSNPGSIALPRFKLEYDVELKNMLIALGMGVAFDKDCADFTNMSPERASIDQVKHKTFVEVNEEGTEAAAVTGMIADVTAAPRPVEQFNMVVDRPFFCAIRDNYTGAILFMGSIVEPKV